MSGRSCRAQGLTSVQQQGRWGTVHWAAEAPHTSSYPPPPCPGTAETQRGSHEHHTEPQAQPTSPGVRFLGRDNQVYSLSARVLKLSHHQCQWVTRNCGSGENKQQKTGTGLPWTSLRAHLAPSCTEMRDSWEGTCGPMCLGPGGFRPKENLST